MQFFKRTIEKLYFNLLNLQNTNALQETPITLNPADHKLSKGHIGMAEDHWWKGALKSFSHPLSQDQVRKLVLSTNLEMWKGWLWKITSFRCFHMDLVAAIHQIFLLVFEAFEPAMEGCWRKWSMGLQWRALSSLTQVLNSHHKGRPFWQVKNRWEADLELLWQKGHKSLWIWKKNFRTFSVCIYKQKD